MGSAFFMKSRLECKGGVKYAISVRLTSRAVTFIINRNNFFVNACVSNQRQKNYLASTI